MEVPEHNYTCPLCGQAARGPEELVITNFRVFWKGSELKFRDAQTRKLFILMFERRGRLVTCYDMMDRIGSSCKDPYALSHVYVRRIRRALQEAKIPITLSNVYHEGYILVVKAVRNV